MPEDLREYVKQRLAAGENSDVLKQRLSSYGYDASIVDSVLAAQTSISSPVRSANNSSNPRANKGIILAVIVTIILIGVAVISYIGFRNDAVKLGSIEAQLSEIQEKAGTADFKDTHDAIMDAAITCKTFKNYLIFGAVKDRCYAGVLSRYDFILREKIKSQSNYQEHSKEIDEWKAYTKDDICPDFEHREAGSAYRTFCLAA